MFKVPWDEIEKYLEGLGEKAFTPVFDSIDGLEAEVEGLMHRNLDAYRDRIADKIVDDAARRTAMAGGGAALPSLLPGAGWGALIVSIASDFLFCLREDMAMLLKLAYLYGHDVSREDRKREALSLLAVVGGTLDLGTLLSSSADTNEALSGSAEAGDGERWAGAGEPSEEEVYKEVVRLMAFISTKHVSSRIILAVVKRIGLRFFRRKLFAVVPGLGLLISGGVNYYSTRTLGRHAKEYFKYRSTEEGKAKWGRIYRDIELFQRLLLDAVGGLALCDGELDAVEREFINELLLTFGYGAEQRRSFFETLEEGNLGRIDAARLERLGKDDRRYIIKQLLALKNRREVGSVEYEKYIRETAERAGLTDDELVALEGEVLASPADSEPEDGSGDEEQGGGEGE